MGDIHINNHKHRVDGKKVAIRRPQTLEKLEQIIDEHQQQFSKNTSLNKKFIVVLNGDIFDLIESWPCNACPNDEKNLSKNIKRTIDTIADNNPEVMSKLKQLVTLQGVQVHYVLGNHERWLKDKGAQDYLHQN